MDFAREKYLSGEFRAKFRGKKSGEKEFGSGIYDIVTYDGEVRSAKVVSGITPQIFEAVELLEMGDMEDVVIDFEKPVAAPEKLFREDLEGLVLVNVRLENVVKDGRKSYGMVHGTLYAPLFRGEPVPTPAYLERLRLEAEAAERRIRLTLERMEEEIPTAEPRPEPEEPDVKPEPEKPKEKPTEPENEPVTHTGRGLVTLILAVLISLVILLFFAADLPLAGMISSILFATGLGLSFIPKLRTVVNIALIIMVVFGYLFFIIYLIASAFG